MAGQAPSIEALKTSLTEFASAPSDRPPTIRQLVHDLHDEIEAALRSRRTFAQIASHLGASGVQISQSSLQAYHREKRRELAGGVPAARDRQTRQTTAAQQLTAPQPARDGTSTGRLNRPL